MKFRFIGSYGTLSQDEYYTQNDKKVAIDYRMNFIQDYNKMQSKFANDWVSSLNI